MAGLGVLLYGALRAIGAIGYAVEDEQSKRNSEYVNKRGQTVCYGRTGQQYIDGEPTYRWTERDKYGNSHELIIGQKSGRVYHDAYDDKVSEWNKEEEKNKRKALEDGCLAYKKFDPRFWKYVAVEIETDKIISCLFRNRYNGECRKFYLSDEMFQKYGKSAYQKTEHNDYGIVISEDEYNFLTRGAVYGCYSNIPSDMNVYKNLTSELEDIDYIKYIQSYYSSFGKKRVDEIIENYFKTKYGTNYQKIMWDRKRNMDGNSASAAIPENEKNNYYKCIKTFEFDKKTYYINDVFECDKNGYLKIGETYVGNINILKEYFEMI